MIQFGRVGTKRSLPLCMVSSLVSLKRFFSGLDPRLRCLTVGRHSSVGGVVVRLRGQTGTTTYVDDDWQIKHKTHHDVSTSTME